MKITQLLLILPLSWSILNCNDQSGIQPEPTVRYIEVSPDNSAYFAFTDGTPYIPVGINMINPSGINHENPDSAFLEINEWMRNLSENQGNYIRIWLSQSFWDIEEKAGMYSEEKAQRIDRFVEMARKYGLRIKVTFEHFRSITFEENPQRWATKFVYHRSQGGPLDSIRQYLTSEEGQQLFLNKIDYYQKRYGSDTIFFGLELWNEMNAMKGPEDSIFFAWNEKMLREVKIRFPENLVMQSLGSFDTDKVRSVYEKMMLLPGNEVAQVHRYLDLGAAMDLCHGPMDLICGSAIQELLSYDTGKPVILAETGAVEPRHTGPSKYYLLDTSGMLLHDILFAPFFSGSAGAGMSWHWESYVHKNKLWYHYQRFQEAIQDINPIEEGFEASTSETDFLRVYQLKGKNNVLIWLRDKRNTWQSELDQGIPPQIIREFQFFPMGVDKNPALKSVDIYNPWKDIWTTVETNGSSFILPDFKRSLVVRLPSH